MPPPVRVDYHSKERQLLERASQESRRVNEQMDRIEANLDNMSDNLKERFKRTVISQLSLMKYRHEDVLGENLNTCTYKSEISKTERKVKTIDDRVSNIYKDIKVWNAVRENYHRDHQGEEKYSNKTSGKVDSATSYAPYGAGESNHIRESVCNKSLVNSHESQGDVIDKPGGRVSPTNSQTSRNVSIETVSPVGVKTNLTSFDQKDKTCPVFYSLTTDDKIRPTIKTIPNEENILQNSPIAKYTENQRYVLTNLPDTRVNSGSSANKTNDISEKSPLAKRNDYDTISTNDHHKGEASPRHNKSSNKEHKDTRKVKECKALKYETRNSTVNKDVLPAINEKRESPYDVKGSTYIHEAKAGNYSTPVSVKYDRRMPSPSFSPISAQGKKYTPSSLKQDKPINSQVSPVKTELQTLVSRLGKYNSQANSQAINVRDGLSEIRENNASHTQSAANSCPKNLGIRTMGESSAFHDHSKQQPTDRYKVNIINNGKKSPILSKTDEHNTPSNAIAEFSISNQNDLTPGGRIRTRTPPTGLHFQSTIRYEPIKEEADFSINSKQKKHEVCCSDCSVSNQVDEKYSSEGNKQVNEKIRDTREGIEAIKSDFNKCTARVGVSGIRRPSAQTPRTLGAISERVINCIPDDRNNDSFVRANLPSNTVTTQKAGVDNKAIHSNTHKLSNFSTDDKRRYLVSDQREKGTRGLHNMSVHEATECLGQTKHDTSSLVEAYAAIKMKLFNSALNSLMSSLKLTVEENVNRDFDREMWTALNKNLSEMKEEFKTFVTGIGSLNSDTWREDLDNLNRLMCGLLGGDTISDRPRIKNDIEATICHLRSKLEDAGRKRLNLLSEVEKILESLTDLTECFAVCGERYFGNGSSRNVLSLKSTGTVCRIAEPWSTSKGFLATAKRIQLQLMKYYTKSASDIREDKNEDKNETSANKNRVQNNGTVAENQDVLIGSNDQRSILTKARQQPIIPQRYRLSQQYFMPSVTRRRINQLWTYGCLVLFIFGIAKLLAHFGPICLQAVYDIFVGIVMYLSCSIRLVHYDPNII